MSITKQRINDYPAENHDSMWATRYSNEKLYLNFSEAMFEWLNSVNEEFVQEMINFNPPEFRYELIQVFIPFDVSKRYINTIYILFKRYEDDLHHRTVDYIEKLFEKYQYLVENLDTFKSFNPITDVR